MELIATVNSWQFGKAVKSLDWEFIAQGIRLKGLPTVAPAFVPSAFNSTAEASRRKKSLQLFVGIRAVRKQKHSLLELK